MFRWRCSRTLERAEVWLRTALYWVLGSGEDEVEQQCLLVWQAMALLEDLGEFVFTL